MVRIVRATQVEIEAAVQALRDADLKAVRREPIKLLKEGPIFCLIPPAAHEPVLYLRLPVRSSVPGQICLERLDVSACNSSTRTIGR